MAFMYRHSQDTLFSLLFRSVILLIQMKTCLWFAGPSLALYKVQSVSQARQKKENIMALEKY